jgi:hypothetical protein
VDVAALTVALAGALVGALGTLFSAWQSMREKRQEEDEEELRQRLFREAAEALKQERQVSTLVSEQLDELTERGEPYIHWMKNTSPSREEMREEFERMLTAFRDRLEQIEQRFPEEAAIDKYASVNEAILDTKIEQLQKSIENLESRILTKWDVATVVFALLGAIGVVAGIIFAVANFVLK